MPFKKRNLIKYLLCVGSLTGVLLMPSEGSAQTTIKIKLIAVNASDETKLVPVKYYLPEELEVEDILDVGPLKIDYNVDRSAYFVHGDIEFKPKESRTFNVTVRDVWQITQEEIDILKEQLVQNLALLKDNENYDMAIRAKDNLTERLDFILSQQVNYSANIGRRIEEYRAYISELDKIRSSTFSLEGLMEEANMLQDIEEDKTIKFVIEVKNPSLIEEKEVEQKHYLPKEIRTEHVLDAQGFDVRFDHDRQKAYLGMKKVFQPGEVKKYTITIKDVWQLPISKIDQLNNRAKTAYDEIIGSDYEATGKFIYDQIVRLLDEIRTSQDQPEETIPRHIGSFRMNQKRFAETEKELLRLEQMLAIVRAKKLEELEKGKVKNILQKLQALKGLAALSEAIFKKGISVTQTWRIIMGTIIFLAIFTTWHFISWHKRSKVAGEELGLKEGEEMKVIKQEAPAEEKTEE